MVGEPLGFGAAAADNSLNNAMAGTQNGKAEAQTPHKQHHHKPRKNGRIPQQTHDGSISDGAIQTSVASPSRVNNHHVRQYSGSPKPGHQHIPGAPGTSKTKPMSIGAGNAATPSKAVMQEAAYAGATFQASPAASSLPVPRFFSKSVPNAAAIPPPTAGQKDGTTSEVPMSSPEPEIIKPRFNGAGGSSESPLDLFFKADRAERDAARRASNTQSSSQPGHVNHSGGSGSNNTRYLSKGNHNVIGESDEDDTEQPSPSRNPVQNRKTNSAQNDPPQSSRTGDEESRRRSQTQSLKDMLMNATVNASSTPPHNSSGPPQSHKSPGSAYATPPPFQRSVSGPSTPEAFERQSYDYPFYGNRNLSPLFKAARTDSPAGSGYGQGNRPPSGLRQEVPFDPTFSHNGAMQDTPNDHTRSYHHRPMSGPHQPPQYQAPPFPFLQHNNNAPPPYPPAAAPYYNDRHQSNGHTSNTGMTASPRNSDGQPRTIRNMEDDLRRMLKLSDNPSG